MTDLRNPGEAKAAALRETLSEYVTPESIGLPPATAVHTAVGRSATALQPGEVTLASIGAASSAEIAAIVSTGGIAVDTKLQLDANTSALVGQVLTGSEAGLYVRLSAGSTPWILKSTATIPGLSARADALQGKFRTIYLSQFANRAALDPTFAAVVVTAAGKVVEATDANGSKVTRQDRIDAKIAQRQRGYASVEVSHFANRKAPPVNARAVVTEAGTGRVLGYRDNAGRDNAYLDAAAALAAEAGRATAAEAILVQQDTLGRSRDGAILDALSTVSGVLARLAQPTLDPGEDGFDDAFISALDEQLKLEAIATQARPAPTYATASDLNLDLAYGQSIITGVAGTGHSSLLTARRRPGVYMVGTAERPAATDDGETVVPGNVWESMGTVVKNDTPGLQPLVGTVRKSVYTFPADGSPPLPAATINAGNWENATLGESPMVNAAYELRWRDNVYLGRTEAYDGQWSVTMNVGVGSTQIGQWVRSAPPTQGAVGTSAYNHFHRAETAVDAALALRDGRTLSLRSLHWWQGVSDGQGTTEAAYLAKLNEIAGDKAYLESKTGQTLPAMMTVYAEQQSRPGFVLSGGFGPATWAVGTAYAAGDVVAHKLHSFISLASSNVGNTPAASPAAWLELIARYAHNPDLTYAKGEWVTLDDGTAWWSKIDGNTTAPVDGANWELLAGEWCKAGLSVPTATLRFCSGSADREETAYGVTAGYYIPNRSTHYGLNGSKWLGSYLAKVQHHVLTRGRNWEPTHIRRVLVRGNEALLCYHAPVGKLTIRPAYDETRPVEVRDWGLRIYDAAAPLTGYDGVSNPSVAPYHPSRGIKGVKVEIVGDLVIRIRAPRDIVLPAMVSYADPGQSGALGNIFDSDPAVAETAYGYVASTIMDPAENRPELVGKPFPLPNPAWPQLIAAIAA